MAITDISITNEYFVRIDFHTALAIYHLSNSIEICVSLFILLQRCYHNDITTVATFSFLRAEGN